MAVNGTEADREPLPFGEAFLQHASHIVLLGSHLTNTGSVAEDLQLHMKKRHPSVIKFYNFIRSNKSAPLKVKLKVMKACVMGSLLHNSETFGDWMPKDLESTYIKLLKCCLDVRSSTPNHLVLIESGFLPVKALILCRQYKSYKRFVDCIQLNSLRHRTFRHLLQYQTRYIKHYESIITKYSCTDDILYESRNTVKSKVYQLADKGRYKFSIYAEINPDLVKSPFIDVYHPIARDIIKFRLGNHYLPIETGRWRSIPRQERLCTVCGVLGDERHALYNCAMIPRENRQLNTYLHHIWYQPEIFRLFKCLKNAEFL